MHFSFQSHCSKDIPCQISMHSLRTFNKDVFIVLPVIYIFGSFKFLINYFEISVLVIQKLIESIRH